MSRRAGILGLGALLLAVACTPEVADDGVSNGGTSGTAATHAGGYAGASLAGAGGAETQAGGGSGGAGSGPSVGGSAGSSGAGGGSDQGGSGGSEHVDQGGAGGSEPVGPDAGSNQGGTGGSDVVEQGGAGGADVGHGGSDLGGAGGSNGQPPSCDYQGGTCDGLFFQECDGGEYFEYFCDYNCEDNRGCFGHCTNGDTRCRGETAEGCVDGEWTTSEECSGSSTCIDGACSDCVPGDRQCNGSTVELCAHTGHWEGSEVCDILCSEGACAGSCQPGTTQCSARELQLCSPYGEWSHAATCPNACVDGSCVGVCVPGSTRCSGTTVQNCSVQGQWQDSDVCPFVCSAGACVGECTPGQIVCDDATAATKTCSSSGFYEAPLACPQSPEPADWHLVPTCSYGTCGIACEEGYDDCDGNGSCTNQLATDRNNCGICGHECGGGNCKDDLCQQLLAATPLNSQGAISSNVVVFDGKLYWGETDETQATGYIVEQTGSAKVSRVNAQPRPSYVSSNGGRLCWIARSGSSSQGDIVCLGGGLPSTIVAFQPTLYSIFAAPHMNGTYAAWSGAEKVWEANLLTGAVNAVQNVLTGPTFVADTHIYWAARPGGSSPDGLMEIRRATHGNGSVETLVDGQENVDSMFASGNSLVWIANRSPNNGRPPRVLHMALDTRVITLLHEIPTIGAAGYMLTMYNDRIYWLEHQNGFDLFALMRTSLGEDSALQLSGDGLGPHSPWAKHLAMDGAFAYWTNHDQKSVMKVSLTHWSDFSSQ